MNRSASRVGLAIVRLSIVTVALALAPAAAQAQMTAITVPWVDGNPTISHVTWSGTATVPHYVTVKGIVRGGSPTAFSWDFGDGTASCKSAALTATGTLANGNLCTSANRAYTPITAPSTIWNLGMQHNYIGNVGQLFVATLYVTDGTNVSKASYSLQIQAMTSPNPAQPTDQSQMDVKVEVAEDEALWALHVAQVKNTSCGYGQPCGYWGTDEPGSCAAIEAFELHGSTPGADYTNDPYVETVQRGLNWLFSIAQARNVSKTIAGYGSSDANSNGVAIFLNSANSTQYGAAGDNTYVNGICGAALAASASPNLTTVTGSAAAVGSLSSGVFGRTYGAVTQDVVDWLAYSQQTSAIAGYNGGWWYAANYSTEADGSTNQWPIVAMTGAEQKMGSIIPPFVKPLIPNYLNTVHNLVGAGDGYSGTIYGGYGYTTINDDTNIAKTGGGMLGLFFTGQTNTNTDILKGMGFMYTRWSIYPGGAEPIDGRAGPYDYNLGATYAMYDVMKSMQAATPPFTKIVQWSQATNAQTTNSFDWYYSPAGQSQAGLAATVLAQQDQSSYMMTDTHAAIGLSTVLTTAWDTLILMRALSTIPPKAVICNCSAQWPVNSPVTFDGTCSVEPDAKRVIYDPAGYAWDYNYDGVNFVQSLDSNNLAVQGSVVTNTAGYPRFTEDGNGLPLTGNNAQTYTVALRVTDDTGQSNITTCNVNIKPPPHCPNANTGGPYNGYANVPVQFDATGSTQVDNDPLTYAWDFHNLNNFTDSTLPKPTHIWASATPLPDGGACTEPACTVAGNGTYPIELEVILGQTTSDAGVIPGCTTTAYTTVIIGDHNPVASAGGPYTGLAAGDNVILDATASYDPDKNPGGLTYAWDTTGRNLYTDFNVAKPTFVIPANTAVGTSFPVCVRVSDVSQATGKTLTSSSSCTTVTAIHAYEPPTCVVAPVSVQSCNGGFQAVTVDGSHSTDPNGDHFTFAWSSTDCPAFDTPTASKSNITFSTAQGGKFFSPAQAACIPQCTATLTVTNDRALSSTCSQVIKISDLQTPTFATAPANKTIECDANAAANVAAWLASPVVSDICAPPTEAAALTNDFMPTSGCGGVGTSGSVNGSVKVTFTAVDKCNSNTSQSSAVLTVSDTQPPVLTLPGPTTAEATSPSGAVVTFAASANDAATGPAAITCTPPSGSTFAFGNTTVTCTSTDPTGHKATGTFVITVSDTKAPTLTLPSSFSAEATSAAGAPITYTATAVDVVDGATTVVCSNPSGTVFAIGPTLVTCTSTDAHGNKATGMFTVTVTDHTPPTISTPAAASAEATSAAGAPVTFTVSATDPVSGSTAVTCVPASGSEFAIGTTTVTCTSTDSAGNKATTSFGVTVKDTTAPAFAGQTNGGVVTVEATAASGATVATYGVTANDAVDGVTAVTCTPAAPQLFALGTTPVSCTTEDKAGNVGNLSFSVAVVDTTPPVVTCPPDITIAANGPLGAVNWNVNEPSSNAIAAFVSGGSDHDTVDPLPTLVNNAPWMFPVGQTTAVTFTATDAHQNAATCVAHVTVTNQVETAPLLTCPSSATLASGAGADIDWSAVFQHPVSVQLLTVSGAGTSLPLSLSPMADQMFQLSSAATDSGSYAIRIRATDEITGSAVDCNRFLSVTPSAMPADKSKSVKRSTIPAAAVQR